MPSRLFFVGNTGIFISHFLSGRKTGRRLQHIGGCYTHYLFFQRFLVLAAAVATAAAAAAGSPRSLTTSNSGKFLRTLGLLEHELLGGAEEDAPPAGVGLGLPAPSVLEVEVADEHQRHQGLTIQYIYKNIYIYEEERHAAGIGHDRVFRRTSNPRAREVNSDRLSGVGIAIGPWVPRVGVWLAVAARDGRHGARDFGHRAHGSGTGDRSQMGGGGGERPGERKLHNGKKATEKKREQE